MQALARPAHWEVRLAVPDGGDRQWLGRVAAAGGPGAPVPAVGVATVREARELVATRAHDRRTVTHDRLSLDEDDPVWR